ncbi:methyltransferase domain-containing protein [candidate division KSB1 bacterium]|nr:methyltransferase domain-containing protein [candidate division KSB1 bacterium]
MSDNDLWLRKYSQKVLTEVGLKNGQTVLDFGCRIGNYTIPAAMIVGHAGNVYALDKNQESLNELMQRSKSHGLENIERIDATDEVKIPLPDESVDVVLLYDVIHLVNNRKKLFYEVCRIAKQNALISVLPKHFRKEMHMNLEHVKNETGKTFSFEKKIFRRIDHDDKLQKGHILNYRKKQNDCHAT